MLLPRIPIEKIGLFFILCATTASALQCYRKCNCLRSHFVQKATSCIKNVTYLNINIDKNGIIISCSSLKPSFISNMVSFDAGYLTSIDNDSPLTIETMVKKCQKARNRNIRYSLNMQMIRNITITSNILTTYPDLAYLDIENNLNMERRSILNLEPSFLQSTSTLKALTLKHFNLIRIDDFTKNFSLLENVDLSSNNLVEFSENIFNVSKNLKTLSMANNKISLLNKSQLEGLQNITYLDLSQNQINTVEENTFEKFSNLLVFNISFNNLLNLSDRTFIDMKHLEILDLSNNKKFIPSKNIFKELSYLKVLNLSNCNLKLISGHMFEFTSNLQVLNLSRNDIASIENNTFSNLTRLVVLDLSFNKIQLLPDDMFMFMQKIRKIFLNSNSLIHIDMKLFSIADYLELVDASTNMIGDVEDSESYFEGNELILRNNRIEKFPYVLLYNASISNLDLSENSIEEIILDRNLVLDKTKLALNLTKNLIKNVDVRGNSSKESNWTIAMNTKKNFVRCNCEKFDIDADNKTLSQTEFYIDSTRVNCINRVDKCPVIKIRKCPMSCYCSYKMNDFAITVDCSFRNLTKYPLLAIEMDDVYYKYNQTILLLNGNYLDLNYQEYLEKYHNVSILDLSDNEITEIQWIPPHVTELNLMGNKLKTLSEGVLESLRKNPNLNKVYLGNNLWTCDSNAIHLQKFLIEYNNIKVNKSEVICNNTGESLVYTKLWDQHTNATKMIILISVTIALAFLSAFVMLFYCYGEAIKIYLYSKNICLWCVAEEELDREKEYDIFISYSHKDETFVHHELLKELESGDIPFKICIHYRDWLPGEFISKQIVESVLNSRRTLVILSNNFMESVWGKMEFRTAHTQAISEGRARVIVIIYGDLNEDGLDDEMKTYLKTNTYVKWGDPWFWNKLKYALPHSKIKPFQIR